MKELLLSIGFAGLSLSLQAQQVAIWGTDYGTNLATSATTSPTTYRQRIPIAVDTNGYLKINLAAGSTLTVTGTVVTATNMAIGGVLASDASPLVVKTQIGTNYIANASQSDVGVSNFVDTVYGFTFTNYNALVTNLASGICGVTQVVVLPSITNNVFVYGVGITEPTNAVKSFDLLFCKSPITWTPLTSIDAYYTSNVPVWSSVDRAVDKVVVKAVIASTDAYGLASAVVDINQSFSLWPTSYMYMIYRSGVTNFLTSGGSTSSVTLHFNAGHN